MDDLVARLSEEQEIVGSARPNHDPEDFRAAIERGLVHVKFVGTGTELGVRLGPESPGGADFESSPGSVRLSGELTLNYTPVRFVGEISLRDLKGRGRLEPR